MKKLEYWLEVAKEFLRLKWEETKPFFIISAAAVAVGIIAHKTSFNVLSTIFFVFLITIAILCSLYIICDWLYSNFKQAIKNVDSKHKNSDIQTDRIYIEYTKEEEK